MKKLVTLIVEPASLVEYSDVIDNIDKEIMTSILNRLNTINNLDAVLKALLSRMEKIDENNLLRNRKEYLISQQIVNEILKRKQDILKRINDIKLEEFNDATRFEVAKKFD